LNLNTARPLCRVFIFIGGRNPPTRVIRPPAFAQPFTFSKTDGGSVKGGSKQLTKGKPGLKKLSRREGKLAAKCSRDERGFAASYNLHSEHFNGRLEINRRRMCARLLRALKRLFTVGNNGAFYSQFRLKG